MITRVVQSTASNSIKRWEREAEFFVKDWQQKGFSNNQLSNTNICSYNHAHLKADHHSETESLYFTEKLDPLLLHSLLLIAQAHIIK